MSKDGQTICFNYWIGGTGGPEIHTGHSTLLMKADGTLTFSIDSLFDGSWLPNGGLVMSATVDQLYGEKTFRPEGLYLISADLSTGTTIGTGLVKPKHPAASPDGKRVAFSMNGHIWVINIDGTGLRQVTTGTKLETSPCWSPDGKYIACSSYGVFESSSYSAIAAVPADNATVIDLVNSSSYWVKDVSQSSNITQGRLTISSSISWK
ncbi:MAG: PD40 domain-containing protein [Ignavibacteria bacterium]|nr:PD40 domain-containing protein [Ignavibacteria bacterium]